PYVSGVGPEVTIDPNTGMISGMVSPDPLGNPRKFPVALTLTDGSTVRQALLLMTVVSDAGFPTITSSPNAILRRGQVFSYTITSSSGVGFNYIGSDGLAGGALPPGLS